MRTAARSQPRKRVPGAAKVAAHLAASPHEFVVTRFEQGLICAAAAFYRFYGSLLGREGRVHNVSGQDNAILQQIMAASRPLAVTDIARFANRDDIANIQYSLKKLVRAGLIAKAGRRSARETSYVVTPLARKWTASFVALRRQLFTDPSAQILGFDDQLEKSANLLNLIAGFYDHGTRVMTGAEQMETRRPTETQASVSAP
jgi:predicted MarR family transcription regulator